MAEALEKQRTLYWKNVVSSIGIKRALMYEDNKDEHSGAADTGLSTRPDQGREVQ